MKSLKTTITIDAPARQVWQVLMDFQSYTEWNPFILAIKGEAKVGHQLTNTLQLEGQKPQVFKPTVLRVEAGKSFHWLGHLFIKGLFDGHHYFELETLGPNQTRLVHGEKFTGLLSGLILKMIGKATRDGFEKMNQALKARVEAA
ncbi:MAG: hypothetical protein DHS20C18_52990 [Saprospiraceae bacterium]|nr:MAG: hypothetical protein DHS20C18_52990 [Saprospiraceae bacterium]